MRVLVKGGTHLGIVGGYKEKVFNVETLDDIEKQIREEFNLQDSKAISYGTIHALIDDAGQTQFEWKIVEILDRN